MVVMAIDARRKRVLVSFIVIISRLCIFVKRYNLSL